MLFVLFSGSKNLVHRRDINLWPHQNFVRWEPRGRKSRVGESVTVIYLRDSKIRCFEMSGDGNVGKGLEVINKQLAKTWCLPTFSSPDIFETYH